MIAEVIVLSAVILLTGFVVISNQNNNANRIRQNMLTLDDLKDENAKLKAALKKKPEYDQDFGVVLMQYFKQLRTKGEPAVVKYNYELAETLYQLAALEYGSDCVEATETQELSADKRYYNRIFYLNIHK